ncbi:MAG: PAS domain-containing protein, partial [Thermoleophilia bacterium]|nr:PAS domain-containing protein [Thermoleophilia bacterium]
MLFGWVADIGTFKRIAPGLPSMKANTAIGFVVAGIALWLVRDPEPTRRRCRIAAALSFAVAALGLLTLAEYVFHVDLGIDGLFEDTEVGDGFPGRTSPHSALALAAVGLWLGTIATPEIRRFAPGRTMSVVASLVVLLAGIGYLYDVDYLRRSSNVNGMGLHTLFAFLVLCAGIIAARPQESFLVGITSDGPGGQVVRRLVPGFVGLGIVFGILRAVGKRTLDVYGTRSGTGLVVASIVVVGVAVVLVTARQLDRVDDERRRLQRDLLRRSEARLEAIVETTSDVIATLSREGVWTYVNPAVRDIYGYEPEEMVGRRFADFTHPERVGAAIDAFDRIIGGEAVRGHETVHRRKDGSAVVMSFNTVPVRDERGEVTGLIATGADITERWLATARARAAHERLEAVLDRTPALVFIKDRDGRYTFANRAVEEFFGLARDKIVGRADTELFAPEIASRLRQTDRDVLDGGETVRLEEHVPHRLGLRAYLTVKFPLRDAEGRIVELCAVATDITELQQRQDELTRRRDEQAAISALGATALAGVAVDELAGRAAQMVVELLDVDECRVDRLDADGAQRPLGRANRPGP